MSLQIISGNLKKKKKNISRPYFRPVFLKTPQAIMTASQIQEPPFRANFSNPQNHLGRLLKHKWSGDTFEAPDCKSGLRPENLHFWQAHRGCSSRGYTSRTAALRKAHWVRTYCTGYGTFVYWITTEGALPWIERKTHNHHPFARVLWFYFHPTVMLHHYQITAKTHMPSST